jgi:molybdate transport system substrate-binding protein
MEAAMISVRRLTAGLAAVLLVISSGLAAAQNRDSITVLAAASLANVMQDIGKAYETAAGKRVVFSFAGSMILAKQIEASAGADVFISADTDSMDYLQGKNLIAAATRTNVFGNSLVLIAPAESKTALTISRGFDLAGALRGGRLAIADPETVPAGRYGRQALTALGVWDQVKGRLAQGEDVRATLAYVARGEAPLGIVYATDALIEPRVRIVGTFPENTHAPIVYPAALTKDAKPGAEAFLLYLKGPAAGAILQRQGFTGLSGRNAGK